MASQIPQPIIDWLKQNEQMLNWDLIWSWPLLKFTQSLQQSFERRVEMNTVAKDLGGSLKVEDFDIYYELDSYQLSTLCGDIEQASYNRAQLKLGVSLEDGAQVTLDSGKIYSVRTHRAANPLEPSLDLQLQYEGGALTVDLRNADYRMDLGSGDLAAHHGRLMAELMFHAIRPDQSTLEVAHGLPSEFSPLVDPQRTLVLTQASSDRKRHAILLFTRLGAGEEGVPPVDGTGFPLLLSDNAQGDDTCTLLISRQAAHRTAFGQAIQAVLEGAQWSYQYKSGVIVAMTSAQGSIDVPSGRARLGQVEFELLACQLLAGDGQAALKVDFLASESMQTWSPNCALTYRYRNIGSTEWVDGTKNYKIPLNFRFTLEADSTQELGKLEIIGASRPVAAGEEEPEPDEIEDLIVYSVRRGFINALSDRLSAKVSTFLLPTLRDARGSALRPVNTVVPGHLAFQGQFVSAPALRIEQQGVRLIPDQRYPFTTSPALGTVEWRLEQVPGYSSEMGALEQSGVYTAPGAEQLKGKTLRCKVVAHDLASGQRHATLLTVASSTTNVEPSLQIIHTGEAQGAQLQAIDLNAYTLTAAQSAGELKWTHTNIEGGKGGELQGTGRSVKFIPNASSTGAYCSIDRLDAFVEDEKGKRVGSIASGIMFRRNKEPTIKIGPEGEPVDGTLQLKGMITGRPRDVDWTLPLGGPGHIDKSGLYTADPSSGEAFVIVRASYAANGNVYEGDFITALPLGRYAELRARQVQQALAEWDEDLRAAEEAAKAGPAAS